MDNILTEFTKEKHRQVVVILTASTNYLFGQIQLRLFRILQENIPALIDVYPAGHCMYGCQSCAYAYTHRLPITFTNYMLQRHEKPRPEKDFELLLCPSYSFEDAPFSFLSNRDIVDYISTLNYSHAIKLHPLAYEFDEHEEHPFLGLTDLEKEHVKTLISRSKSILSSKYTNTLNLIEHARVIICDSNSSIPFETLYFHDKKYVFVYETSDDYDEQDDRQTYFHKFQTVEQLKGLIEDYFHQQLTCKTENSHEFFLEKYDEPNGNEIEQLGNIRQWITAAATATDEEVLLDRAAIKQAIDDEFKSAGSPMTLYALGDHTMSEVVQLYLGDENHLFGSMHEHSSEL